MFINLLKAVTATVIAGTIIEAHASDYTPDHYQEYLYGATKSVVLHPACLRVMEQLSGVDEARIDLMREMAVITSVSEIRELRQDIDLIRQMSPEVASVYCAFQVGMLYGGYEGFLIGTDSLSQEFFASEAQ